MTDNAGPEGANGLEGSANITVEVLPVPDAPVAQDDLFLAQATEPVEGNVLQDNGQGPDEDVDDDVLTIDPVPVLAPQNGTVVLSKDGSFEYTADKGFRGKDSFDYRVTDGALTDVGRVFIDVFVPDMEPIAADDTFVTDEDALLAGNVLADNGQGTELDPENGKLTVATGPITAPQHGKLFLVATGSFNYVPNPNYHGPDSFAYQVSDEAGGSDTATVEITVATDQRRATRPQRYLQRQRRRTHRRQRLERQWFR